MCTLLPGILIPMLTAGKETFEKIQYHKSHSQKGSNEICSFFFLDELPFGYFNKYLLICYNFCSLVALLSTKKFVKVQQNLICFPEVTNPCGNVKAS
jgi:hypothetical protein